MVKLLRKYGEEAKVQLRNVRHTANDTLRKKHNLKNQNKEGVMSDDEWKKAEADVQKITDSYIARAQDLMKKKEEEVLEI